MDMHAHNQSVKALEALKDEVLTAKSTLTAMQETYHSGWSRAAREAHRAELEQVQRTITLLYQQVLDLTIKTLT